MALPKAAQAQVEAADKIYNEVYGKSEETENANDTTSENIEETTDEVETSADTPEQPADESTAAADTDWEHKYKTLQGMYNAEVPKFSKKAKTLEEENASLRAILASLEEAATTAPAEEQPVATAPVKQLVSPEEVEEFGADLIDVVRRAALESVQPELQRLRQENDTLRSSLGDVSKTMGETARKSVYVSLAENVPDWQEMNSDENFLNWLGQPDVFSGQTRQDLLRQAFEKNDAERVIAFFKSYIDETAVVQPTTTTTQAVTTPPVNTSSLVAPGKTKAATVASTQGPEKRIWTQQQIAAFYSSVRKGEYKDNEADKRAIEKDIIDAANTGRIR